MLTAIAFMLVNVTCYVMSLRRGPIWAVFAYMNIYFNPPDHQVNWWASYLPFTRWSLLTSAVLILAMIIHWDKRSDHKLSSAKWLFWFFSLSMIVTLTNAFSEEMAYRYQYLLFTYCLIVFILIKAITDEKELRWFLLATVLLTAQQSVNAFLYGRRINARLEGIGSSDAYGSNEFALLIAGVIPFMIVFLRSGRLTERVICFLSLPFIINAFILCNSRGAAVAFILGAGISAVIVGDGKTRRGLFLFAIVAAPLFWYLMDDEYKERFSSLFQAKQAYQTEQEFDRLSSGRTAIWGYGLQIAADHPYGIGPNGFGEIAHLYMPEEILTFDPKRGFGKRAAHNTYLQVLVEQGVLGLILWLAMCATICLKLRRNFKLLTKNEKVPIFWKDLVFAMTVSFLTTLAGGLVTNRVYYEFFWWQIALVVIGTSLARKLVEQPAVATAAIKENSI